MVRRLLKLTVEDLLILAIVQLFNFGSTPAAAFSDVIHPIRIATVQATASGLDLSAPHETVTLIDDPAPIIQPIHIDPQPIRPIIAPVRPLPIRPILPIARTGHPVRQSTTR